MRLTHRPSCSSLAPILEIPIDTWTSHPTLPVPSPKMIGSSWTWILSSLSTGTATTANLPSISTASSTPPSTGSPSKLATEPSFPFSPSSPNCPFLFPEQIQPISATPSRVEDGAKLSPTLSQRWFDGYNSEAVLPTLLSQSLDPKISWMSDRKTLRWWSASRLLTWFLWEEQFRFSSPPTSTPFLQLSPTADLQWRWALPWSASRQESPPQTCKDRLAAWCKQLALTLHGSLLALMSCLRTAKWR